MQFSNNPGGFCVSRFPSCSGSEQLFLLASIAYFRVSDGPFGHDSGVTTIATTDDAASRQPSETQPLLINQQQLIQEPRDD
jgi:hypothetical protein